MNREILFRGKRVDNGEWVFGVYVPESSVILGYFEVNSLDAECDLMKCKAVVHKVKRKTVGQYTDLIDKNGRRVFEGDIVENIDGIYVAEYCKSLTCFALLHDGLMSGRPVSSGTVIGNIHDNPEMLKGETNV